MNILTLILFVLGFVLLVAGAELLVRGASRLAVAAGISPLVIGLTVVAYGTSAPELAVSAQAALNGQADISVGNVVGSNIFNILFILGCSALIAPLLVSWQLIRQDVPLMIGVSLLLPTLSWNGRLDRWEGVLLFGGALSYTAWTLIQSRRQSGQTSAEAKEEIDPALLTAPTGRRQILLQLGFVAVGVGLLIVGSQWLVEGAITLARWFNISELVIGLTIISVGTSLPEVATSLLATLRGHRDIAVGNVIGSNIFNILAVLGLTAALAPGGINISATALHFDMPIMALTALACLPIFFTGGEISRWEGGLFLGYYVAYTLYLLLNTTAAPALTPFSWVMLALVLPVSLIPVAVSVGKALRRNKNTTVR